MIGALVIGLLLSANNICPAGGPTVVVSTREHTLWLCENGRPGRSYPVALGRGGVGKRAAGDTRTPLGAYPLGQPRPSEKYGIFIPVGYPTEEQKRQGFSGSDIGVHGPKRSMRWLGRIGGWLDWTRGCIAVATDERIGEIAAWVRTRRPAEIHIE